MKKFIVSTVGTSLLSNVASREERNKLYNAANCREEKDCTPETIALVEKLEKKALERLAQTKEIKDIRRISAELNGIYGFYEKVPTDKEDIHFLLTTDTYQGEKCGELLQHYLKEKGLNANVYTPSELTTRTKYNFEQGIKKLLKWCDQTLTGYENAPYEIVFNLTGSFKSLQGYMNTIAMFYADKIIYIFESERAELIEIPKLPIEINKHIIEQNKEKIILMAAGYNWKKEEIENIPETIIDEIEGKCFLSVWGELLWNRTKGDILKKELIEMKYLHYTEKFKKLFEEATEPDKVSLQETLAKVSALLMESKGDISILKKDGGLQYENYNDKFDEEHNIIGHFRINRGDRVSCVYKNNTLVLRKFGRHDFVNNNP
jgi:putative CRISPR-associated protein (TIGR02619 family)